MYDAHRLLFAGMKNRGNFYCKMSLIYTYLAKHKSEAAELHFFKVCLLCGRNNLINLSSSPELYNF